jgi:hypothetical protein
MLEFETFAIAQRTRRFSLASLNTRQNNLGQFNAGSPLDLQIRQTQIYAYVKVLFFLTGMVTYTGRKNLISFFEINSRYGFQTFHEK